MEFVLVAIFFICSASVYGDEKYSSKLDAVNLDEFLKNDRLVNAAHKCLLDQGGCTPEIEELRKIMPEAIETGCAKCADDQKKKAKQIASFLIKTKPDLWESLITKYDPDNTYRKKFKDQLKAEGFDI